MFQSRFIQGEVIHAPKETVLMKQDEEGDCAYLLLKGLLQIHREVDGEKAIIRDVYPIELIGELAIMGEMPRSATVTVLEDAELLKIDKHRLRQIIRRYPDVAEIVIKIFCRRLEHNAKLIEENYAMFKSYLSVLNADQYKLESFDLESNREGEPDKESSSIQEKSDSTRMIAPERREEKK